MIDRINGATSRERRRQISSLIPTWFDCSNKATDDDNCNDGGDDDDDDDDGQIRMQ